MGKLDELVTQYGEKHFMELALNKECKEINGQIKTLLEADDLTEYTSGDYTVIKTITKSESLNEAQLLDVIKADKMLAGACIKTREYVDMEALESALYKGKVSQDTMLAIDKCRVIKEIIKLNLKKAKKEGE